MKHRIALFVLTMLGVVAAQAGITTDAEGNYLLGTADDVVAFASLVNEGTADAPALVTADIDMTGQEWTGISGYKGTFDGQGHAISNLAGPLFLTTSDGVTLQNLTLAGSLTSAGEDAFGAFIATHSTGAFTATNLTNRTKVVAAAATNVGGLVGYLAPGAVSNITECKNEAEIIGLKTVGGLIGYFYYNNSGNALFVKDCSNSGNVTSLTGAVGGIVGNAYGRLEASGGFNSGNISAEDGDDAGGFFGAATRYLKSVSNFRNTGNITGNSAVGGIVGSNYNTSVTLYFYVKNCTNEGEITARVMFAGGMVGRARASSNYFEYTNDCNKGTISGAHSAAIAGESRRGDYTNCYNLGLINTDGEGRALVCGGTGATLKNCWNAGEIMLTDGSLSGETLIESSGTVNITNCYDLANIDMEPTHGRPEGYDSDWLSNGHFAYFLNGNTVKDAVWYQTLGQDEHPVLDKTHGLVFQKGDDSYGSAFDDITELKAALFNALREYAEEVVAYQGAIDEMLASISELDAITDRNEFIQAYYSGKLAEVQESEKAYQKYIDAVALVHSTADESNVSGTDMDILYEYLEGDSEECETYPNGSYYYIIESKKLTNEEVTAEIAFANELLDKAIRNGYKSGDEITNLMVNANLAETPNFTGWEYEKSGSTFTTGGVKSVMPTAEAWNATFDMKQTLTGLANGIYELRVNAAFRPAHNINSTNVAAFAYANENETYVATESEDVVSFDEAQDSVNCYITEGASNTDYEYFDDVNGTSGYVPYGPVSCSFAFNAGRYENIIVANVTDGTLTVGLRLPGTGCAEDWLGFGNFRLFYQGELNDENALGALQRTLEGMAARAQTQIDYMGDSGSDYKAMPQFSKALRAELQAEIDAIPAAATGEEKLQLVARFTKTFNEIYACKKAYVVYMDEIEKLYDRVYSLLDLYPEIQDLAVEMNDIVNNVIIAKWEDGEYSTEEALAMDELHALSIQAFLNENLPDLVDGFYQLKSPKDLMWLAATAGLGVAVDACLTQDIDMTGQEWVGIQNYRGTFDGQGHTISNLGAPLFALTQDATTIKNLIVAGSFTTEAEARIGAIVADHQGTNFTMENCVNRTDVIAENCESVGGLVGRLHANNAANGTLNAKFINCVNEGNITGKANVGGFVGTQGNYTANLCVTYQDCANKGNVTAKNTKAGGLMGTTWGRAHYFDSYNTGNVTCEGTESSTSWYSTQGFVGGLVGNAIRGMEHFERCYNAGSIKGNEYVGGLLGGHNYSTSWIYYDEIVECWNVGEVDGSSYVGGLMGISVGDAGSELTLTRSYNAGKVTGARAAAFASRVSKLTANANYNTGEIQTNELGGVLVAYISGSNAKIQNAWNSGTFTTTGEAAPIIRNAETTTVNISNTYDLANVDLAPQYGRPEGYADEWLTSGAFTYFINSAANGTIFYQTLGEDQHPVLDWAHGIVYQKEDGTYTNTEPTVAPTIPTADLLDIVFNEDGTAEDVSPMHNTVEIGGTTASTYFNETYQRYVARFENPYGSTCSGFYKVDFENNEAFRAALANGHTLEVLCMLDYEGDIPDAEAKPFSAMQGGGTGFLICKTNASGSNGQNVFTFLPNVTTTGSSTWQWTTSGIVPEAKKFYHVVGVWDPIKAESYIYVNGELKNTLSSPGEFKFASAGCNWFAIGGDPASATGAHASWPGDVAIARAYDKPLTAEEVALLWTLLWGIIPDDGIGALSQDAVPAAPFGIFRLNGVRVDKAQQGIYIINGKKVLVK
ncbi:MAG: LamG domain-containing protein [Bacteroidaceae bacterium]|nr:LamG domain-containing protein [Bacteroidaceae bacterium]